MTWPVRRVPTGKGDQFPTGVFVVTEPDRTETVVRFTPNVTRRWRCATCEHRSATTDCLHTFSVALYLAETELGLTRIPDLEVTHV